MAGHSAMPESYRDLETGGDGRSVVRDDNDSHTRDGNEDSQARSSNEVAENTTDANIHPQPGTSKSSAPHQLNIEDGEDRDPDLHEQAPYEVYARFSTRHKVIIVAVVSFCGLITQVSSTTILSAIPEVAKTYSTSGDVIALSNALYLVFMGLSPCFWGPLSQVYGRRKICLLTLVFTMACSIGTALAPKLSAFFIFRMFTAFFGTSFMVTGPAVIGDIYHPTARGGALSWFMTGTVFGPSVGPMIGGVIITFRGWQVIFWLQTALAGAALLAASLSLPETLLELKIDQFKSLPCRQRTAKILEHVNPLRVVWLLIRYPNLMLAAVSSGTLIWNMYGLLTPIRYVLNPRFSLTSPTQAGLFYLAPGVGCLLGAQLGGRWADRTVRRWIRRRNGTRIPEDRLRSCLPFLGVALPACMLVYGWTIDQRAGGAAVPIVAMVLSGVGQFFCYPSLNAYCLDVNSDRAAEVVAGNFMARYFLGAAASALVLPAIRGIGVGWFNTVSAAFLFGGAVGVWAVVRWGKAWRIRISDKRLRREQHE